MSGGSSSKPQEVQASAGEKAQAQLAQDQINYYRSTYAPLEKRMVDEANQDYSDRLSGQAGTAAMRASTQGLQAAGMSTAPVDTAALSGAVTQSRAAGLQQGQQDLNSRRLDALGVGLGMTADATRSLSQAAGEQTSAAIQRSRDAMLSAQAKTDEKNALLGAAGSLAGAAGTYYGMQYLGQPKGATMSDAASKYKTTPKYQQTFSQRNALINGV